MSFSTSTYSTSEDSAAIELHAPTTRLEQQLQSLEGVRYAAVRSIEDVLLEDVLIVQVRGGDLQAVVQVLAESDLGPFDFHHTP